MLEWGRLRGSLVGIGRVRAILPRSRDCKPVKGLSIQAEIGKKSMRLEWGILGSLLGAWGEVWCFGAMPISNN